MNFKREVSDRIISLAEHFPVIVLTGARQTGKTTLLKNIFPTYHYVSLDLPSIAELAENDPQSFLAQYPQPVIIDEIQYAPTLFRYIKIEVDKNRDVKGQFILTGSQKFTLMKHVSDSLAGRCVILELETLSLSEIANEAGSLESISDQSFLLHRGFFPELWKDKAIPSDDYYRSYLASYLERDVRQIINVRSLRDFERFIRLCAVHNAQLLNKAELATAVGVKQNTINEWLTVLEASNQITLLEPFFENIGKRIVKTPKIYFNDSGLLCFLLNLSAQNLPISNFIGNIWEGFVFSEIRKHMHNNGLKKNVFFYRDQQNREVDFLLWAHNDYHLIETKWTEHPTKSDCKNTNELEKIIRLKKPDAKIIKTILSRTVSDYLTSENVNVSNGFRVSSLLK